jgi:hypothetical protein
MKRDSSVTSVVSRTRKTPLFQKESALNLVSAKLTDENLDKAFPEEDEKPNIAKPKMMNEK